MSKVFGEVADLYEDVRPGYPDVLVDAVRAWHGREPVSVVDVGAGTGKVTEHLVRRGWPVRCVEPDEQMAAVLRRRLQGVPVDVVPFERWQPPAGGVDLVTCGLAWHWLDPSTRAPRARAALAPGGTLAVLGIRYDLADPGLAAGVEAAVRSGDAYTRPHGEHWVREDVAGSGLFRTVDEHTVDAVAEYPTDRFVQLMQTFGHFRQRPVAAQAAVLTAVRSLVDGHGGVATLALRADVVLARV